MAKKDGQKLGKRKGIFGTILNSWADSEKIPINRSGLLEVEDIGLIKKSYLLFDSYSMLIVVQYILATKVDNCDMDGK